MGDLKEVLADERSTSVRAEYCCSKLSSEKMSAENMSGPLFSLSSTLAEKRW